MSKPVIWSPTAKITYFHILEYLDKNWTRKELKAFVERTEEALDHIRTNPALYPYSKESNTHRCVIVKQVSLFYRNQPSTIELLVFWDTRQDLSKLLL